MPPESAWLATPGWKFAIPFCWEAVSGIRTPPPKPAFPFQHHGEPAPLVSACRLVSLDRYTLVEVWTPPLHEPSVNRAGTSEWMPEAHVGSEHQAGVAALAGAELLVRAPAVVVVDRAVPAHRDRHLPSQRRCRRQGERSRLTPEHANVPRSASRNAYGVVVDSVNVRVLL
jgi:hypothetical protein